MDQPILIYIYMFKFWVYFKELFCLTYHLRQGIFLLKNGFYKWEHLSPELYLLSNL